ncbi:hypothetical protein [Methylophilus sp. QUAN]|uniref:DUF6990 domain-containing protein n=1 Tax=Methylophilus sp. QUAN TaxID=2781020 RepID=UPI00188E24ED|nr:hypothetical protein [Methylophilus sp. QUAN]MBF4992208.1 hypothetical protein [Methylophilus sp. QUAN]
MIKMKEVRELFKAQGWLSRRDEAGDLILILPLKDRILDIIPTLKKTYVDKTYISMVETFSCIHSVTTEEFNHTLSIIDPTDKGGYPIVTNIFDPNAIKIQKESIVAEDIINFIPALVDWAYAADIEEGLKKYRALPTDSAGSRPFLHLAALACHGNVDTLLKYQQSFEQGDRLGFVPYITKEMIDRAVEYAKQIYVVKS